MSVADTYDYDLLLYGCSGGSVTVASGGAFDLTGDDNNGYPMVDEDCGSSFIDVQSGGTLVKTGGTGTSTVSQVWTLPSTAP